MNWTKNQQQENQYMLEKKKSLSVDALKYNLNIFPIKYYDIFGLMNQHEEKEREEKWWWAIVQSLDELGIAWMLAPTKICFEIWFKEKMIISVQWPCAILVSINFFNENVILWELASTK